MKKQIEFFGRGSIKEIKKINDLKDFQKVFLLTGKSSYETIKDSLEILLEDKEILKFNDFENNPKIEDVKRGIELYREFCPDLVIAIGGGSVIDVAKSINLLAKQRNEPEKYVKKELFIEKESIPLVAIPTTAGTGSEATHFSVVYIDKKKYSLAHESMLPDYVILDPDLTNELPPKIAASTAMDALCQAIESFWSVNSTEESKSYSKEAISIIIKNLDLAINKGNRDAKSSLVKASNLAGKAINIAKTTASHAVSYPITSYFGVPHGHAVALTLGQMIEHNYYISDEDCNDKRGAEYVKSVVKDLLRLLSLESAEQVPIYWKRLVESIGLEMSLLKLGISSERDLKIIMENGFNKERVKNNPRNLNINQLRNMLEKIR